MPDEALLIVSGDRSVADTLRSLFSADGFACRVADSPEEALSAVGETHPSVVIVDDGFPNGTFLRLVGDLRDLAPTLALLCSVREDDTARALEACRAGACELLTKPFDADKVTFRTRIALGRRRLNLYEATYRLALESRVNDRTRELWDKQEKIQTQILNTINALVTALQAKHDYTGEHSRRVADVAISLARALDLKEEEVRSIELAALFHDIGKIGIRDTILNKPGLLTPDEYDHVKQHPLIAEQILSPIEDFGSLLSLVKHEHERFDGTGYPSGLKGEEIPLGARIIAIADTFDALVTDRSYRKGCATTSAMEEIRRGAGTQFDPRLVETFVQTAVNPDAPPPPFSHVGEQAPVRISEPAPPAARWTTR